MIITNAFNKMSLHLKKWMLKQVEHDKRDLTGSFRAMP